MWMGWWNSSLGNIHRLCYIFRSTVIHWDNYIVMKQLTQIINTFLTTFAFFPNNFFLLSHQPAVLLPQLLWFRFNLPFQKQKMRSIEDLFSLVFRHLQRRVETIAEKMAESELMFAQNVFKLTWQCLIIFVLLLPKKSKQYLDLLS